MVEKHPEVKTAYYWKNRTRGGYAPVIKLANEMLSIDYPREDFYLTTSRKGVPLLIIKDETRWMSITYFGKSNKYRLFTDYIPNGTVLNKLVPVIKFREQKRIDFSNLVDALNFIKIKGWRRWEYQTNNMVEMNPEY